MPHETRGPVPEPAAGEAARRAVDAGATSGAARYDEWLTDVVADASLESFPASDPPAWIGMRAGRPRR